MNTPASHEKSLAQLRALNRLAEVISSTLEVEKMLQTILQEALNLTAAGEGAILSLSEEEPRPMHTLFKSADTRNGALNSAFSDMVGGWILKHQTHLLVEKFAEDPRFRHAANWFPGIRAVLAVPMKVQNRIIGIIILTKKVPFARDELELLAIVAVQCGQLLENAKHFAQVYQENLSLRKAVERQYDFRGIIGGSPGMVRVFDLLERIIPGEARVLIQGESGTGKELIAKIIHYNGPRKQKPFIAVDCGALPENLLESEFFGHVKGAFTGAINDKKGVFEIAHQGTLFLDEIANTTPNFQARLLRAIQEGEIKPVGAAAARKVDVRIIAATSTRLPERVAAGEFREDLYYRLNVIAVDLPPLRERREDIPLLADHFLKKFNEKNKKNCRGFDAAAMRLLESHDWPGNIRELENVVERAVALAGPGEQFLSPALLPDALTRAGGALADARQQSHGKLPETVELLERRMIAEALNAHAGNRTTTAEALGITRQTLIAKIKKYGLD